jgi:hypothetical protein
VNAIRIVLATGLLTATIGACSPPQHPTAVFLLNGIPTIEYKSCDGFQGVRDVSIYASRRDRWGEPIWHARVGDLAMSSRRITLADRSPGYRITGSIGSVGQDQLLVAETRGLHGDWLGVKTFTLAALLEGKALTLLGGDGSIRYEPLEDWRADLSDCPGGEFRVVLLISSVPIVLTLIFVLIENRRRKPGVKLPVPPPSHG